MGGTAEKKSSEKKRESMEQKRLLALMEHKRRLALAAKKERPPKNGTREATSAKSNAQQVPLVLTKKRKLVVSSANCSWRHCVVLAKLTVLAKYKY